MIIFVGFRFDFHVEIRIQRENILLMQRSAKERINTYAHTSTRIRYIARIE